jgi:hypothetical protein
MKKIILVVALILIQTTSLAQNTLDTAIMNHDVAAVAKLLSDPTLTFLDKKSALKKARTEFESAEMALEGPAKMNRLLSALILLTLSSYLGLKQIPRLRGTVIEYNSPGLTYVGSRILSTISVGGLGTGIVQLLMGIFSKTHEELQSDLAQAQKIIQLLKQHKEEL